MNKSALIMGLMVAVLCSVNGVYSSSVPSAPGGAKEAEGDSFLIENNSLHDALIITAWVMERQGNHANVEGPYSYSPASTGAMIIKAGQTRVVPYYAEAPKLIFMFIGTQNKDGYGEVKAGSAALRDAALRPMYFIQPGDVYEVHDSTGAGLYKNHLGRIAFDKK